MRLLLALLLLVPSTAEAGRFSAIIAAAADATRPGPAPAPSDKCENCDGRGKVGDGVTMTVCPVCNGTGKATTADGQATPMKGVGEGLAALKAQPGKTLVVFGSGFDARWEITAARQVPTLKVVGIEIDPEVAESARRYVEKAGLTDRITIITGDATKIPVEAEYGAAYLWPDTLAELKPQIQKLERFVSYSHEVPGLSMKQVGDIFVYDRHQVVMQPTVVKPDRAVWNGRSYSGPVCSRPNCSMCNALRAQLQPKTVYRPVVVDNADGHWMQKCVNGVCTKYWVPN